jgi:Na+/pantothenate symporter
VARAAALAGGVAGMVLAIGVVDTIIQALGVFYSLVGATLFVPVVGGLLSARADTREAMASIVCGMAALLAVQFGTDRSGWLNPNLWGLAASAAAFGVVRIARRWS